MNPPPGDPLAKVRILGIDPGTRVLGYGILDVDRSGRAVLVDCGALRLPPRPLEVRLETIFREIGALITRHRPRMLAIEQVFHGKNFQSVLKVGEARGVVVLSAQMAGLEICEYAPALIKKAATGNGNADKAQVQSMMGRFLGLAVPPEPEDVTDALAAAFCHGQRLWRSRILAAAAATSPARPRPRAKARRASQGDASARSASWRETPASGSGREGPAVPSSGGAPPSRASAPGVAASRAPSSRAASSRAPGPIEAILQAGRARVFRGRRFRKTRT